jgi:hypothetical protein
MTHDERKSLYEQYRDTARKIYGTEHIIIPKSADVKIIDNGAFVETLIWIVKEELSNESPTS